MKLMRFSWPLMANSLVAASRRHSLRMSLERELGKRAGEETACADGRQRIAVAAERQPVLAVVAEALQRVDEASVKVGVGFAELSCGAVEWSHEWSFVSDACVGLRRVCKRRERESGKVTKRDIMESLRRFCIIRLCSAISFTCLCSASLRLCGC